MSATEPDYDADMRLPTGKTCSDCRNFTRCSWLISCEADRTSCDWWPSRFSPKPADGPLEGHDEDEAANNGSSNE